jgi:hypothetical protein
VCLYSHIAHEHRIPRQGEQDKPMKFLLFLANLAIWSVVLVELAEVVS